MHTPSIFGNYKHTQISTTFVSLFTFLKLVCRVEITDRHHRSYNNCGHSIMASNTIDSGNARRIFDEAKLVASKVAEQTANIGRTIAAGAYTVENKWKESTTAAKAGIAGGVAAVAAPLVIVPVLGVVGFTSAGIAAGSTAASLQTATTSSWQYFRSLPIRRSYRNCGYTNLSEPQRCGWYCCRWPNSCAVQENVWYGEQWTRQRRGYWTCSFTSLIK